MILRFLEWLIGHRPKYVESGKAASSYIKRTLAKTQGRLTQENESRLIEQIQRKFRLSEESAAILIRTALEKYSKR